MRVKDIVQQAFETRHLSLLQETYLYELFEARCTDEEDLQAADSLIKALLEGVVEREGSSWGPRSVERKVNMANL